MLIINF